MTGGHTRHALVAPRTANFRSSRVWGPRSQGSASTKGAVG
eukprot:CAMPEP_0177292818 /NCGR_PEP_ID=MMETSP0368-20130122/398_1 /TAXON_ID=447022 ORGANISM="Scrippsiella hangoei-like, Strain SHHI-4" /NCGR_SAMPLE_ID=MMETSP0368 /ASSEMBLY_ACC=CAM_ASM_000363 /LENGTH=39 /DNA_ID= /DNA_START= /DNA_END= /DNA_ORIENTATION=